MVYFPGHSDSAFSFMVRHEHYDPVKGHTGVDYLMPVGTPLQTPVAGIVVAIRNQEDMGTVLYIQDEYKRIHVFAHLSEVLVTLQQKLYQHDIIARSGKTGRVADKPHLHYEIIAPFPQTNLEYMKRELEEFSGYNIDPEAFLQSIHKPHWSDESLKWLHEQGIITQYKNPDKPITWGEFAVVSKRLTERLAKK